MEIFCLTVNIKPSLFAGIGSVCEKDLSAGSSVVCLAEHQHRASNNSRSCERQTQTN